MLYVNEVSIGNETLISLKEDTVKPSNLGLGETAHDASGAPIIGTAVFGERPYFDDNKMVLSASNYEFNENKLIAK